MVGATSRSAPPLRSVAARGPRYTNGTGPTVCAVCGWPVSRVAHHLEVAVVGGDQQRAAGVAHRRRDRADRDVDRLGGLDRRGEVAGVADHVRIGDVADDRRRCRRARIASTSFCGHLRAAHLRLQVVGGDLRARHQDARPRPAYGVLAAAAEEEGDVRVLLGLGDAQLRQAVARRALRPACCAGRRARTRPAPAASRRIRSGRRSATARRRGARSKPSKSGAHERRGELARAVGAEVHEHHRVAVAHRRAAADHGRRDELVVLAARIGRAQARPAHRRRRARLSASTIASQARAHAVPALVAVHRVVAAADAWRCARCRACVAAPPAGARRLGSAERGGMSRPSRKACTATCGTPSRRGQSSIAKMCVSWLCTPPGDSRPIRCSVPPPACAAAQAAQQLGVGEEAAVLDRRVDAGQVLVDDAAGAEVHVADFGIAHLPVRQADVAAFGMDQRVRALGQQARASSAASAWARALSVGSSRWPQPSRISRTTGLGRGGAGIGGFQ